MSESTSAAVTTISFILVVTNVIGNSLVCWIIKKNRNMRYVGYKRRLRIGIKYSWLKFAKWMIFIVDLFLCVRRVSFPVSAEEAVALGGGGEGGKLWCWAGGGVLQGKLRIHEHKAYSSTGIRLIYHCVLSFTENSYTFPKAPCLTGLCGCLLLVLDNMILTAWKYTAYSSKYSHIRRRLTAVFNGNCSIPRVGCSILFSFSFFSFLFFFFFSIPQNILELSTCQPGCSRHLVRGVHSTKSSCQIDCLPPRRADRDIPVQIGDRWKSCMGWKRFLDCYPGCHLGWAILFGHVSI